MAHGLGMSEEEWHELRAQVDGSFWVMRIIGPFPTMSEYLNLRVVGSSYQPFPFVGYPPLPDDHDGFSCGAHKCVDGLLILENYLTCSQGLWMLDVTMTL